MKLSTHLVTGFSVAVALALYLGLGLREAALAGLLALVLNYVIDVFGHAGHRRSPLMHSLIGVTLSTTALFLALTLLGIYVPTLERLSVAPGPGLFVATYVGALSHLLLDTLTEGGTYLLYPFSRKRCALAHLDYDNPLINALAAALSIALLLYVAWSRYGHEAAEVVRSWLGR